MNRLEVQKTLLVMTGLTVVIYARALVPGQTFIADVLFRFFYPLYHLTQEAVRQGSFPLWNPYLSCGMPFLGNGVSALFYPATYLFVLFDFSTAIQIHVLVHTVLAGTGMRLLARSMGLSVRGALLSGVVYAFNGFAVFHFQLLAQLQVYAWLPVAVHVIRQAVQRKTPRSRSVGIAVLAVLFFGGYLPFFVYSGFIITVTVLIMDSGTWRQRLGHLTLITSAALVLAAVQLGPTIEFAIQTSRAAGMGSEWALAKSLSWPDICKMLFLPLWSWGQHPDIDTGVAGFYWGYPVLILATLSLRKIRSSRLVQALAVLTVIGLVFSAGRQGLIYPVLAQHVWPFSWLRYPSNALLLPVFSIAILAGLGFDATKGRSKIFWAVLCLLDLGLFAQKAYDTIPRSFYRETPPTVSFLRTNLKGERILMDDRSQKMLSRRGHTRYEAFVHYPDSIIPDYSAVFQFHDAAGGSTLQFERHRKVLETLAASTTSPWLNILGVRYLLSFWPVEARPTSWAGPSGIKVFENKQALPRAYFTPRAVYREPIDAFNEISQGTLDPRQAVVINEPEGKESSVIGPLIPLGVEDVSPNRVSIRVKAPTAGWVVLADSYDVGWRVNVNGEKRPAMRANYLQRAVRVPAGESMVEWHYRPDSWSWAIPVSVLMLVWLFLGAKRTSITVH